MTRFTHRTAKSNIVRLASRISICIQLFLRTKVFRWKQQHLYTYVYVYMYICIFKCKCICIGICIYVYVYVYTENGIYKNGNFRLLAATVIDDCCFSKGAHLCNIKKINLQEFWINLFINIKASVLT